MHIVITGNLADGFKFYGPFGDVEMAHDFLARKLTKAYHENDWTIAPLLVRPEEEGHD